jgi:hypothetical protein
MKQGEVVLMEMFRHRRSEVLSEKPVVVSIFLRNIPHRQA